MRVFFFCLFLLSCTYAQPLHEWPPVHNYLPIDSVVGNTYYMAPFRVDTVGDYGVKPIYMYVGKIAHNQEIRVCIPLTNFYEGTLYINSLKMSAGCNGSIFTEKYILSGKMGTIKFMDYCIGRGTGRHAKNGSLHFELDGKNFVMVIYYFGESEE